MAKELVMKDVENSLGFSISKVKLTEVESSKISESLKDYSQRFSILLNTEYKDLSRLNAKEFFEKFKTEKNSLEILIFNQEETIQSHFDRIKELEKQAKDSGIPEEKDPYWKMAKEYNQIVKKLSVSLTHRILMEFADKFVEQRFLSIIEDIKKLEFEKMKSESEKNTYEDMYKKIDKMRDDERNMYQDMMKRLKEERNEMIMELKKQLTEERNNGKNLLKSVEQLRKDLKISEKDVIQEKTSEKDAPEELLPIQVL